MADTADMDKQQDRTGAPRLRRMARAAGRGLVAFTGDLFAVLGALAVAALWIGSTLAARQQTDLSPIRGNISQLIAQGFDGATTDIGALDLRWYPSREGVVFTARDVTVFDRDGAVVQTLPLLRAGVGVRDLASLRKGAEPELRDVELIGGEVTWLERADGTLTVGLGTPETVGRFGPVYRGRDPLGERQDVARPPILDAFRSLSIQDSTAYVVNETNGLSLVVDLESLTGRLDGDAVLLDIDGSVQADGERASAAIRLRSPDALQTLTVDARAENVRLDRLAPPRGRTAALRGIAAPVLLDGSGIYSRQKGLRAAELSLTMGRGSVNLAGEPRALRSARLDARFDPDAQVMRIDRVSLDSALLSLDGAGVMREIGRLYDGDIGTSPQFDVTLERSRIDLTPTFAAPLALGPSRVAGRLDIDSRSLDFDALSLDLGGYALNARARVVTGANGLSVLTLGGQSEGAMSADDLLALWPVKFADGARRWIERSIAGGQIDRLAVDVDLDEDFFAAPALTPERLQLAFSVSGGQVRYIDTMPLLRDAVASGRVDGNALSLTLDSGRIETVAITSGAVSIPQLTPRGGSILIDATADGSTGDLLSLINNPPFGYLDRYGVSADGFGGRGVVDLSVKRPLLEFFDRELIEYSVKGKFSDASAPLTFGRFGLSGADVTVRGGKDGLFLSGPADLGPWRAQIDWAERYGQNGEPTRYSVSGTMDQEVLDGLGLGLRQVLGGTVAVRADATGSGVDVREATVMMDLTDADIALGTAWSKVAGERALVEAQVTREDAGISLPSVSVDGPGLTVRGSAAFRPNFALRGAVLDVLKVEGLVDAGAVLGRSEDGRALTLDVDGRWLDVSPYVRGALRRDGEAPAIPLRLSGRVDRLILGPDYGVSDTVVGYAHDGIAVQGFSLDGSRPGGEVRVSLAPRADAASRELSAEIPDISALFAALFDTRATRGGRMAVAAEMPMPGEPGAIIGEARIDDFDIVNAPFLAQILSLASLSGLFDTLSGSGLSFDAMEMDFALREASVAVRDAKLYGPALGMTGEGDVSFADRSVDFSGTLVPAYTANSLLGDIPLIGDIFVGGDGEGIFALTYDVTGSFDAAQVSVNPLSALTPGFLRGIFKRKRDDIPDSVAEDIEAVRPDAGED